MAEQKDLQLSPSVRTRKQQLAVEKTSRGGLWNPPKKKKKEKKDTPSPNTKKLTILNETVGGAQSQYNRLKPSRWATHKLENNDAL